jgi:hypothetical protein
MQSVDRSTANISFFNFRDGFAQNTFSTERSSALPDKQGRGKKGLRHSGLLSPIAVLPTRIEPALQQAKVLIHNGGGIRPLLVPPAQEKSAIIVHVALVT